MIIAKFSYHIDIIMRPMDSPRKTVSPIVALITLRSRMLQKSPLKGALIAVFILR